MTTYKEWRNNSEEALNVINNFVHDIEKGKLDKQSVDYRIKYSFTTTASNLKNNYDLSGDIDNIVIVHVEKKYINNSGENKMIVSLEFLV